VSLALYRRYRPETFAEVIGQAHVTEPLQQAIRNDRVNHAYLFSGPRGCGKTTSARILARALNCETGPTPEPCGVCRSCEELARGGSGSIDVVEIDAASHGGVDDARDLRERAFFSPAASRYKIYIVDEAHMVTTAGFNALLKVVEEPPPHLKFIFATTEPDKVIPTIRSRTHHYPFRLVPPSVLRDYLATMCEREGVPVEPAVLPLVVRAGAGSVRDSLSVLDQLIAGAGAGGVTYSLATALLGYTDAQLLDDVLDAFAAGDGAAVFQVVDRVLEGGHDPRRFVQDLLERFRDLVVLNAVPEAGGKGLIDAPPDQIERMRAQAAQFGAAELSRAADIVNTGLTEMRGALAPRLQLELICSRVLLPGAGDDDRSLLARLDRLERRFAIQGGSANAPAAAVPPSPEPAAPAPPAAAPESAPPVAPISQANRPVGDAKRMTDPLEPAVAQEPTQSPVTPAPAETGGLDIAAVRRAWPQVLDAVKGRRRFTWMTLLDGVQIASLQDRMLTLAFADEGKRRNFGASGSDEILRQALIDVLGVDWRVDAVLDPSRATGATPAASRSPAGPSPASGPPAEAATDSPAPGLGPGAMAASAPADPPTSGSGAAGRRGRSEPAPRTGSGRPHLVAVPSVVPPEDDHPADDDPDADDSGVGGRDLLMRELGARVIEEIEHD
jgi:DNA polymerase-3 subunit gamma/tau